ncbi:MAG: glycosyltransferase [Alphaproteobacteria bacterium]
MTAAVTIAVCTLNRAAMLRTCLESLQRQSLGTDNYRIMVVDNGSTDATPAVVAEFAAGAPPAEYVREEMPGLSQARNRALAACATPLIAFIDDDQLAPPDWLERLVAPFATWTPRPFAVGGDNDPIWEEPRPDWLTDDLLPLYSCGASFTASLRPLERDTEWIFEGNCVADVAALRSLGGFPTFLGRSSASLLSGEGFVFEIAWRRGLVVLFEPAARTWHRIPADRLTLEWVRQRAFWQGITQARRDAAVARMGLTLGPRGVRLPDSLAAWAGLHDMNETSTDLSRKISLVYGLGIMCERMGVVPR